MSRKQAELDAIFAKIADDYLTLNKRQQAYAIREVGRVRGELALMLADFAGSDGIIKRQRINRLMRELDAIEKQLREYGTLALDEIITDTADWTAKRTNGAIRKVVGATVSVGSYDRINREVVRYVTKRFGDDGLILSDRIWATAADIREEISAIIRSGIIRGESVSEMIAKIRRVHDNETWKIRRLVVTEGTAAYRSASALSVERSKVASWVKLNDNPGLHRNHESHRCYELANEDRYGMGAGVFKPTDSEIYAPHPNCTSYITSVLDERYL